MTTTATRSAALISLGCAKNLSDSEDLVTALKSTGVGLTDDISSASVVLVNTCGFIESAKQESIDHILSAAEDRAPGSLLVVAGCLTERYLDELKADIPEVDCWLPFNDYERLPALIRSAFPDLPEHRLTHDQRSQLTPPHFSFLKIAEGCDNTCNFCAIPLFRGKHISRPEEELVEQARVLAARGVKEINLISQHLDYYGKDRYGEYRLPQLLRQLSTAAPESWLRLHYCYPNDFSDDLIATMAELPQVLPYVDMPIQHASDRMLATMGRRTTRAHIEARLDAIRRAMPEVVIRSTFIVGFPGERDEDHQQLLDFLQCQRLDHAGCFTYSDEDGTTAAKMPKKVDSSLIQQRHDSFMRTQADIVREDLPRRWMDQELDLLVDEQVDFDTFHCRHYGQASEVDNVTIVRDDGLQVGSLIRRHITGIQGYDLLAS
ncbi:MAG: 30S ribosomal protein S12 methylthiotransferase RimO [Planctomycetota bacterium]|nr:MAG: 30S ribosomal protein S12 methylthiotransferase RimO [Planctomycetota bacterium]